MTVAALDVRKTLSAWQIARLRALGATVTNTTVTATEDQMWAARIIRDQRRRLEMRGNMAMSHNYP